MKAFGRIGDRNRTGRTVGDKTIMQRRLGLMTLALGLLLAPAAPGLAQAPPSLPFGASGSPQQAGFTQLFVSPCGEPYRGRPGDPYPVAAWFKQADLNHDGVIDKAEFRADHAGFFDAMDPERRGYLDGADIAFYEHRVVPDLFGAERLGLAAPRSGAPYGGQVIRVQGLMSPMLGGNPGDAPMTGTEGAKGPVGGLNARRKVQPALVGAQAYTLLVEAEPLSAADSNLDGRVTKAEFLAAADRRFALLDKRHDGKLTLDELPMTVTQAELAEQDRKRK
jgi:hypothetical protein